MQKVLSINPHKCSACGICVMVCSVKNSRENNPLHSRVKVHIIPHDYFYSPLTCFQCEDAWCKNVCPTGAFYRDEEKGAIILNETKCVGCRLCMLACPFGNIYFDSETKKPIKCDLCDGDPQCAKYCSFGALEYREPEITSVQKGRDFMECVKNSLIAKEEKS